MMSRSKVAEVCACAYIWSQGHKIMFSKDNVVDFLNEDANFPIIRIMIILRKKTLMLSTAAFI